MTDTIATAEISKYLLNVEGWVDTCTSDLGTKLVFLDICMVAKNFCYTASRARCVES